MYNYFNCNVAFLIDFSTMVQVEIVAILSSQKKPPQNQPPHPQTHHKKICLEKLIVES